MSRSIVIVETLLIECSLLYINGPQSHGVVMVCAHSDFTISGETYGVLVKKSHQLFLLNENDHDKGRMEAVKTLYRS